jgi:phosphoribosylformimino-5-aminoimidazole carboxamide ribotide isomerase
VSVPCELGGGIRDEATIASLIDLGLDRLVVGTSAVKDPDWFCQMCRKFPGRLALGLDARGGLVATEGWLKTSRLRAVDLALRFADEPIAALIYTDIDTDGMLGGPNLSAMAELVQAVELPVIASGGVTTADDVARLAELGVAGCIIGRALYDGTLNLPDALARARGKIPNS